MMISPGTYVNMNLNGKSEEEANKAITELREEIARLKKVIEEETESEEVFVSPSPETRLYMSYEYLDAARDFFASQGWNYEPSKEEVADMKFNERLDDIVSIDFEYGYVMAERDSRRITFDGDKLNVVCGHFPYSLEADEPECEELRSLTRQKFLEELKRFHIGEWKKNYENPYVLDGCDWSLKIKYNDNTKRSFSGSNMYPSGFYGLLELLEIDIKS